MRRPTSRGEAWGGDWQSRLGLELGRRGATSLRGLAAEMGRSTYPEVAAMLDGSFAPIQMMMAIRAEFERDADPAGFVCDSMARYLVEHVRAPVSQRRARESQAAQAIGACGAAIGGHNEEALLAVWRRLKEDVLGGWLPGSPSDPILCAAVHAEPWSFSPVA